MYLATENQQKPTGEIGSMELHMEQIDPPMLKLQRLQERGCPIAIPTRAWRANLHDIALHMYELKHFHRTVP